MSDNFYIVYPGGDRTKLTVVEVDGYEIGDYAVASRRSFTDAGDAVRYGKELADKYSLVFVPSSNKSIYLD